MKIFTPGFWDSTHFFVYCSFSLDSNHNADRFKIWFQKSQKCFFFIKLLKIHKWWKYLPLNFWSDMKFYCISACVLFFSLCSVTPEPSLLWRLASNPTTPIWQVFISALCNSIYIPPNSNTVLQFSKELTLCLPLAMKLNCWKIHAF